MNIEKDEGKHNLLFSLEGIVDILEATGNERKTVIIFCFILGLISPLLWYYMSRVYKCARDPRAGSFLESG